MRKPSAGPLVAVGALALVLLVAAAAQANTVGFNGSAPHPKPGQTKGLPVLMGFKLQGPRCPAGPSCFKHAKVRDFDGVSYAFPNCPELLDSAFELDRNKPHPVSSGKRHRFSASGISEEGDKVWIRGRFYRHGTRARGWFKVLIHPFAAGCTTGKVFWTATRS